MNTADLQNNLYWLFLQASFRSKQALMKLAEEHAITVVQLYVLCAMEPHKPLQMNEIAQMLACDPSNVTGIIDRLFAMQAIERKENPKDRRVKMISLTDNGIGLREKIIAAILSLQPAAFTHLKEEQKEQLRELLRSIVESPHLQ